jgi:Rap1a immunity proteins
MLLVFAVLSIASASLAKATTVEKYLKDEIAFTNFHSPWLDGVFNGLKSANAELGRTNKAQLFCPPPNFSMTPQQVNSLFGKFITSHSDKVSTSDPIPVLLLEALQEAYPCAR